MIYRIPGAEVLSSTTAETGLVGTLAFRFVNLVDGEAQSERLTTGIVESPDSPGLYVAARTAPDDPGTYAREWWDGTQAWYEDEDLDVSLVGVEPAPPVWTPSVAEVSALERARTNVMCTERGIFDADTRPTATEVAQLITLAVADVQTAVGITIPDTCSTDARRLAAVRAAAKVESSFFPNEIDSDRSAYRQYTAEYLDGTEKLAARIPRALIIQ